MHRVARVRLRHLRPVCDVCADLLSTLVLIIARQNLQSAEIEACFMWTLIDASWLVGDSRYILMTFCSAVDRLKLVRKSVDSFALGRRTTVRDVIVTPQSTMGYMSVASVSAVDCGVTNLIHDRRSCVDFTLEVEANVARCVHSSMNKPGVKCNSGL